MRVGDNIYLNIQLTNLTFVGSFSTVGVYYPLICYSNALVNFCTNMSWYPVGAFGIDLCYTSSFTPLRSRSWPR